MIKVLINGCNGKMGKIVSSQIGNDSNLEVICGVDREDLGATTFPVFTNIDNINLVPDVIIDFSAPAATMNILEFANKHKIPTVIATTGFSEDDLNKINEYAKSVPIFKASNMSYEVNLMANLVAELAKKLSNQDIEIIETHHNRKVDSPSGTAIFLANSMNNALNNEMHYETARSLKKEKRSKKEIGISSIRGGDVVGKHQVIFFGENESFEITHNVTSRGVFAEGALKAAKFIVNQPAGLYDMNNLV